MRPCDAAQGYLKGTLTGNVGSVQSLIYDFDNIGNLISREDANQSLSESFIYDGLNRLTSATVAASGPTGLPAVTKSYTYDNVGNITNKSDVGDYLYGTGIQNGAGVHAVTQAGSDTYTYDANGNMSGGAGRTITWASFNKPLSIIRGNDSVSFEYDADHNRIRSDVIKNYTETTTTVYLGKSYERVTLDQGIVEHKHYIQVAGATVLYTERSNNVNDTRYLHQDHLGSTNVITNENAQVVERNSFDAFGSRRQTNWQDPLSQLFSLFSRGYTGHEQFDGVGLIHMNGRMYDARLGRFLSADPHVQSLANPQSLNRYTYVNNNPLSFTDPSGYFFKKLFKMIHKNILFVSGSKTVLDLIKKYPWVGVIVQMVAAYFCGPCAAGVAALITESNGGSVTDIFKAAAISYVSAQSYSTLHSSLGPGFTKVVAHGVVGGLSSAASGGKFKHGFLSAGFAQAFSGNISKGFSDSMPSRVIAAAVIGGTAAELGGGKFANGAVTGAFAHLFSNMPAANDDNYGMVSDAEMNYIMATSPRTYALWEVPQSVVDAVASFGDTISFRATNWVRGQLDVNGAVNFDSGAYQGG
ncbi:RHS repeat domain-containing protein [Candidatus Vondammii sp. HM_W22]|uniref:RHS repeat domain-containing protein n=1 Tax=Candidatus Vondammii sp. HM_W22 TaxID=2687299 RepID=UPI001F132EE4|nr:RHS repeat-associated core domain-containing protein [Candidatus Vondammii sp. HM_W22]